MNTNTSVYRENLGTLLESLPVGSNARGEAFEKVVQWFLKTDPAYVSEFREVWRWDDWPGKWGIYKVLI